MKFVETLNGTYINAEQILSIYHEDGNSLVLTSTEIYDFLDCGSTVTLKSGKTIDVDSDVLISVHRHAAQIIARAENTVVTQEKLEEAWCRLDEKELETMAKHATA